MYSIHVTREALIKIIVDGTTFAAEQVAAILPPHNKVIRTPPQGRSGTS